MKNETRLKKLLAETSYKSCAAKFSAIAPKNIYLYGAGNLGKKLYIALKNKNIAVSGFIDKRAEQLKNIDGKNIYTAEDFLNLQTENAVVILAGLFSPAVETEIRHDLAAANADILALHQLDMHFLANSDFYKSTFIGDFDRQDTFINEDLILKAYDEWSTAEEKSFFLKYVKAYLNDDFSGLPQPLAANQQYTAHDILEPINLDCFIDCGAYTGDTLTNFCRQGMKVKNYIAFEPQMNLGESINNAAKECGVEKAIIFPCGVANSMEQLRFSSSASGGSASRAAAEGDEVIQCVALDTVLLGIAPTFIKMDIEGMEIAALTGAKNLIKKYHPQLAICVYHDMPHIWQIPQLIKSIDPSYRLYLRNYQIMGLETVVYAF